MISETDRPFAMTDYFNVIDRYLDPAIVAGGARSRIRAVTDRIPPCSLAGLELRLRDDQPDVDFFARLPYGNPNFPARLLARPVWLDLQRMCNSVADPSHVLHRQVRHVFLEFDLDRPPSPVPVPALFLELRIENDLGLDDLASLASPLGSLTPALSAAQRDRLARCVAALPPGARIAHTGLMLSRPGRAIREVIDGMPLSALPAYLHDIGWSDPEDMLMPLLGELASRVDPLVMLDLDIGESVAPRIGIELYLRGEPDSRARWHNLLAFLVERRFASESKARALLAWPGYTREGAAGDRWSPGLALGDLLLRDTAVSMFWRNLNHIKFGYRPGAAPEFKAYLGFGHNWFPLAPAGAAA